MEQPIIASVKDYIVQIVGDYNYALYEIFMLGENKIGMVINANDKEAFLIADGEVQNLKVGSKVYGSNQEFHVQTKANYFGSVINIYGNYIYKNEKAKTINDNLIYKNVSSPFQKSKGMNERLNLNTPLETGIFAIDLFFPIGLGQRQLIIGDAQTGKTSLALSIIINQKNNPKMKVIYASVGNKLIDLKHTYNILDKHQALDNTIILHAASDNSLQQYLVPYVAMNHAENLMAAGFDVLLVIDNLTNHSHIIRETSLLTNAPVGKEAYPGHLFYSHSQLLERSGKFLNNRTITCLPIVKTISNDITSVLASNIISITDGQIVLNSDLKNQAIFPAVDLNTSVSRLGSAVQFEGLRKVASNLNKIYNLYNKNIKFSQVNFEFSASIKKILNQGELLLNLLKQKEFVCYVNVFIVLLAYLVFWDLISVKGNMEYKINYLQSYMKNDFCGKILQNAILNLSTKKISLDETVLKENLEAVLNQSEAVQANGELVFNDKSFKLSPKSIKQIKENLWEE